MIDTKQRGVLSGLSRNVVVLGFVSLFTDISSEMLYPVIPLFLTSVLHAPMTIVGAIEGAAECTASLMKLASGRISDRLGRRMPFVLAGYALSAMAKPLLALAGSWHVVLASRMADRFGKGVRTSPRDAMIASASDSSSRGKAYGLHRAMDTAGAVAGPLIAILLLSRFHAPYRTLFLLAFIPAAIGVAALAFVKRDRAARPSLAESRPRPPLSPQLKTLILIMTVFAIGNSSDVFLLLRAKNVGFGAIHVILVYVMYNAVYAMAAGPVGWLSDRVGRRVLLGCGFLVFAGVYLGFGLHPGRTAIWLLFACYGLYAAANEGVAKAFAADLSVSENRATAMGTLQAATGVCALVAGIVAGTLWTHVGAAAPFIYGAACSLASGVLLMAFGARLNPGLRHHPR